MRHGDIRQSGEGQMLSRGDLFMLPNKYKYPEAGEYSETVEGIKIDISSKGKGPSIADCEGRITFPDLPEDSEYEDSVFFPDLLNSGIHLAREMAKRGALVEDIIQELEAFVAEEVNF